MCALLVLSLFGNITCCCCDLEISVHIFIFMCFMIFVFLSPSPSTASFFRHHPHPRSISKLLTKVSALIIKMCLDFFMASSICFFCCCCYQNLSLSRARLGFISVGCVSVELKDCKLNEWIWEMTGERFIEIDDVVGRLGAVCCS